jgi:trehalose-phosphatase
MTVASPSGTTMPSLAHAIGIRLDGTPLAVMLDIDGTLAPIAPTPAQAAIPRDTLDILKELVAVPAVHLVLVSGRSADDAYRMAPIAGAWVIGNHGFESRHPNTGVVTPDARAEEYGAAIRAAIADLRELERAVRGVIVESKRWTVSVHYRLVMQQDEARVAEQARAVAGQHGLVVTTGKKVLELRPNVPIDKGTATVAWARQLGGFEPRASLLFAGDDVTDEDAFRSLRAERPDAVTIRIGDGAAGTATAAEFQLGGPEQLRELLAWLCARRRGSRGGPAR